MQKFVTGQRDVGLLVHWPFDNPLSDYRTLDGTPICHGRLDAGGPGHEMRRGFWRCSAGVFECTEQGDELMTVLHGACRITDLETAECQALGAGDSLFLRDGMRVRWEIPEEVTKVFFGWKPGGY